jgi:bifunctional pyridoxal-dependent enzyme with beta-cystathionase and maltose regulon repressor activities
MNAFEGLDLSELAARRSHKWRGYPREVRPAFIAAMDYDQPNRSSARSAGASGDGSVRVTIGTSSALLTEIADRMAAAV